MPLLQVLIASTRPGRKGPAVADWMIEQAQKYVAFEIERVDLAEIALPIYDEPNHPRLKDYKHDHTKQWSLVVDRADAFVFVTPEYDFGPPASLLNAMQYLVHEWSYKPLGFVSYGGVSAGTRSVVVTKQVALAVKLVPILESVSLPFFNQYFDKETGRFVPGKVQDDAALAMLKELLRWTNALRVLR